MLNRGEPERQVNRKKQGNNQVKLTCQEFALIFHFIAVPSPTKYNRVLYSG